MLPYKTIVPLDKKSDTPLYLQITNAFIRNISNGVIPLGTKLPGSRTLSDLLAINRRTVISAYEELEAQGWVTIQINKGCFVSTELPIIKPTEFLETAPTHGHDKTPFALDNKFNHLPYQYLAEKKRITLSINDGYPDVRIAPLKELSKHFSYVVNTPRPKTLMNYSQAFYGDIKLREEIVKYLAETRGINISLDNIIITRGSLMAFYLLFQSILEPGDNVIVGNPGFNEGHNTIKLAKGNLIRIPIDEHGMDIDAVEEVCQRKKIRALFIVPHHQYPTTVSLSASRRMKLLILAEKYNFAIIEDDYDYDFHYSSSPILPMASADQTGSVAYVGSLSKTVAPSLRIGYIVAPKNLIQEVSRLSRFIDSHGNTALERAIAMLFENGEHRRHIKKATKLYRQRRDYFCELLNSELGEYVDFKPPEGGLAVWVKFKDFVPLQSIISAALGNGFFIPDSSLFCPPSEQLNATRMGFASLNEAEMHALIEPLKMHVERSLN